MGERLLFGWNLPPRRGLFRRSHGTAGHQWLIIQGRAVGKLLAPLSGLLHQARRLAASSSRSPARARPCIRPTVFGALALRSLVAWALRLSPACRRNSAPSGSPAATAVAVAGSLRRVAFGHRPHVGERTAIVAEIFVDRHLIPRTLRPFRDGGCGAARPVDRPASRRAGIYLSGDSGIVDAALDVLDRPGRRRHDVEVENLGRQPQRGAGIRNIDDAGDVALHRRGAEDGIGLGAANSRTSSDIRSHSGRPGDRRCARRGSAACPARRPRCPRRSDSPCSSA